MRAILFALGALVLLAIPVVLLNSVAESLGQSLKNHETSTAILTPGMYAQCVEHDQGGYHRTVLRQATVRPDGHPFD